MGQQLERLLQSCTVKLSIPGKIGWGTGFFVAPGLILTCHHVVKDLKNGTVHVCWQNQEDFAEAEIKRPFPELDLALLKLSPLVPDLPCVYLDESFQADDNLYTYGYPDDFPQGASVTGKCEGLATDKQPLIKFKAGQVRPGLSGSPLLNQRTGKVCGIVKFTRDRSFDLGGGAVPTSEILSQFPELEELQQAFHQRDDRWTKLLPRPPSPTHLSRQEYRNRQALLNKVNNFWVKGVLERSLYNQVLIELGLEERPDTLAQPWNILLQTSDEEPTSLPQGTKVIDLFDEIGEGRTLLILGEPGSGKTTTLLELTRDLIARAEQDVDHLIPVVFNLSSWAVKKQKIEDWLVEELNRKYQVPKKIGNTLVSEDKLLLLLDGLDEVKAEYRDQCITALNQFNQEYCPEIVVCSRIKDYEALSSRLNFQSAVYLRLLTLEQIRNYLESVVQVGRNKSPVPQNLKLEDKRTSDVRETVVNPDLAGLRALIEEDTPLQELAESPLMLNIMTLAYQGLEVKDLSTTDLVEEWQKQLFDNYIEKMFKLHGASQRYEKPQAKQWLIWLAKSLQKESQTIFLIEDLQPTLLLRKSQKKSYRISLTLCITILFFSINFVPWSILSYINSIWNPIWVIWFLISAILLGSVNSRIIANQKIQTTGKAFFSVQRIIENAKRIKVNQFIVDLFKLLCCFNAFIIVVTVIPWWIDNQINSIEICFQMIDDNCTLEIYEIISTIIAVDLFVLIVCFLFGAYSLILSGFDTKQITETKRPNQGMFETAFNRVFVIIVTGFSIVIFMFIMELLFTGSSSDITSFILMFMWFFSYEITHNNALIQHFALRFILYRHSYIPWNYARFLNYATERIFLQKVGGGYIFIHRMLMEHFAKMKLEN